jgi:hypothetical protein
MKKLDLNASKLKLQKEKITDLVDPKKGKEANAACSTIPTTRTQPFTLCNCPF